MKSLTIIFSVIFYTSLSAQYSLKIKKEDNRFVFFQIGTKNDTLIKNKTDKFVMILPDSLKGNIQVFLKNGQFVKTDRDSIYLLRPIPGMKYSHSKQDTNFVTLLEGNCEPSKNISIEFINTLTQQRLLRNNFIVK